MCVVCTQTKLQSNMLQNLFTEIEIFTAENNKTKKEQKEVWKFPIMPRKIVHVRYMHGLQTYDD